MNFKLVKIYPKKCLEVSTTHRLLEIAAEVLFSAENQGQGLSVENDTLLQ